MKFFIYMDRKKEWRWTLKAVNGRKIADSAEGYKNRAHCLYIVKRIRAQAGSQEIQVNK